jgi:hypothetical protein
VNSFLSGLVEFPSHAFAQVSSASLTVTFFLDPRTLAFLIDD